MHCTYTTLLLRFRRDFYAAAMIQLLNLFVEMLDYKLYMLCPLSYKRQLVEAGSMLYI